MTFVIVPWTMGGLQLSFAERGIEAGWASIVINAIPHSWILKSQYYPTTIHRGFGAHGYRQYLKVTEARSMHHSTEGLCGSLCPFTENGHYDSIFYTMMFFSM